ncbi:MAG: transcriptional regulator [Methylobacter sp.]|jgi:DNA-binding phage protein|nr:transcriptional regulator [Methylobacter sp.]
MTLTRSFKTTVIARVEHDTEFRDALLREGVECLLSGDVDTGKAVLRDYINATIGFENLSEATNTPPKSLMRMFSQRGNPQAKNLFAVLSHLQTQSGIHLEVRAVK